jgi:hypothetical protein
MHKWLLYCQIKASEECLNLQSNDFFTVKSNEWKLLYTIKWLLCLQIRGGSVHNQMTSLLSKSNGGNCLYSQMTSLLSNQTSRKLLYNQMTSLLSNQSEWECLYNQMTSCSQIKRGGSYSAIKWLLYCQIKRVGCLYEMWASLLSKSNE